MPVVVSSFIPFPNIWWWLQVAESGALLLDAAEHYQKMSYRNRYYISGANGLIQLSIPLVNGRNQRCAASEVQISHTENWQVQHWRTIVSVYARTPYFEYYEPGLKKIFDTDFTHLGAFCRNSVEWLSTQLKLNLNVDVADQYQPVYTAEYHDIRQMKPGIEKQPLADAPYYQIFQDRTGFLPNLSMLDLLLAEGPHALSWLRQHKALVQQWGEKL